MDFGDKKMEKIWKKLYKKRFTFFIIAVITIIAIAFFGRNFVTIYQLEEQKSTLTQQIEEEKERAESLNAQLETVGTRAYIEKVARSKYKLYYPNEMIVTPVYDSPKSE